MIQVKTVLLALIVAASATPAAARDLGVGVPAPAFGLEESDAIVASLQESGNALNYFVNNQHPSAVDRGNKYGSPDKPRKTIPSGDLAAGSIITLDGGPYEGRAIRWSVSGSLDAPVLIRGAARDNKTVIRQKISLRGQYAIVENLRFDRNRISISIVPGSSHLAVRSNQFFGPAKLSGNTSVLSAHGNTDAKTSHIIFADNEIRSYGDTQPGSKENDYHGIKASRFCSDIWILGNRISNMGGDSVQIGDANLPDEARCSRIFIARNDFSGNRENAIDIKRANGVVISENDIHDFVPPSSIDAPAVVIHYGADSVWALANVISNASSGIVNTFGTHTWLIGNRITNMRPTPDSDSDDVYGTGSAVHFRGASTGGAILNVFRNYRHGIQIASGAEYLVSGNVFAGSQDDAGYDVMIKSNSLADSAEFSYNLHTRYSARIGSSRSARGSSIARSPIKTEKRMLELLGNTLCRDEPLLLADMDTPETQHVVDAFTKYFGGDVGIGSVPAKLDLLDQNDWCDPG